MGVGTGNMTSNQPDTVLPTVRRFSQWCLVSHGHDMLPRDDGAWVRYDDVRAEIERLRAALDSVQAKLAEYLERLIQGRTLPNRWVGEINDILVSAYLNVPCETLNRVTDETTEKQSCAPDDHLYAARAGSPIGDGVCIKCGAQEVK